MKPQSTLLQQHGLFGSALKIEHIDGGSVCTLEYAGGTGVMTCYPVFPGVDLIYNEFRAFQCVEYQKEARNLIEINHCRRGRYECVFNGTEYGYLGEGDMAASLLRSRRDIASFPLGYYEGAEVLVDCGKAVPFFRSVYSDLAIDFDSIRGRLFRDNWYVILRTTPRIAHIFDELYAADIHGSPGYRKLKILELFLFLNEESRPVREGKYYTRDQIRKIKQIRDRIVKDCARHTTLQRLAQEHRISRTFLQSGFRAVYGKPVYSYLREYRMDFAARMLRETRKSVTEIAGAVGYDNVSKFSAAFQRQMGVTPLKYRKM